MKEVSETKVCTRCGIEKSRSDFYFRTKNRIPTNIHPKCKKCHNRRIDERRKNKDHIIIKKNLSSRTRIALKNAGTTKNFATSEIIGCTLEFLKVHLEKQFKPGMSWDNYGMVDGNTMNGWHIDHIKPCNSFNLLDPEEQKQCFHYTNLQPMWAVDNIKKGCKVI